MLFLGRVSGVERVKRLIFAQVFGGHSADRLLQIKRFKVPKIVTNITVIRGATLIWTIAMSREESTRLCRDLTADHQKIKTQAALARMNIEQFSRPAPVAPKQEF